jgi:hypothetical protein
MHEFESIRPYRDQEVAEVVARLVRDRKLIEAASRLFLPRMAQKLPGVASWLSGHLLRLKAASFDSIGAVQAFLARYFDRLIDETISELTVTGLDLLDPEQPRLFISNHRDIIMDTGLLNFVLHRAGYDTPEAAVGDNLLAEPLVADLMRLNKSFVVERSVTGKRAVYRALSRTSHYIRHVLESGHSVWIAQREGRSKDGFDRTDPALLKMLALAWRKDCETFGALIDRIALIPVAISYELDPCDRHKARELAIQDRDGTYEKGPDEDLMSIVDGMIGFKGRVQMSFCPRIQGDFETSEDLALAIDRAIVGAMQVFPTQAAAATSLGYGPVPETAAWLPEVQAPFEERINGCPEDELPFLLAGYGNLIRNRAELGV